MKFLIFISFILWTLLSFAGPGIVFIVNEQTPVSSLTVSEIKDYYFKRKRQWPDGTSVRFVDRSSGSEIRKIFLSSILQKSSEDLDLYWIGQKLYSGDNAPLQQSSESLTLQLVSALKGSISYISDSTPLLPKGVRIIKVNDAEF